MSPARLVGLLFLLVGLTIAPGYVDNVDSKIILRTAEQVLDDGTWGVRDAEPWYLTSTDYGSRGPDGAHQMKFGPGNVLLDVPSVALGRATLTPLGLSRGAAGEAGASLAPAIWFAICGMLLFGIAGRFVGDRASVAAALLTGFATYLVVYGKSAYLELPLAAAVLGAFLAALRVRDRGGARDGALLGLACVAVLWIKLAALALLVGLAPVVLLGGLRKRRGAIAAAAGVFVAGVAAFAWLNHVRFGSPFDTGYATSVKFTHPLVSGIVELLVSPAGGLLLYSPVLLLAAPGLVVLARRDGALAAGILLTTAAALVLYGMWCSPLGGDVWGSRYLLPLCALLGLPVVLGAIGPWQRGGWRRGALCALVAFSAALQVPPTLVSFQEIYSLREHWIDRPTAPAAQALCARILVEKVRSDDGTYDLGRLGLGEGRHRPGRVESGLNLWPTRVATDLPRRATAAWCAWTALVVAALAAAAVLLRRIRTER